MHTTDNIYRPLTSLPRSWSSTLNAENITEVADILDSILRYPCAVISIVKDISHVDVYVGCTARLDNGRACQLHTASSAIGPWLSWHIADQSYSLYPDSSANPVKILWRDGRLRIDHNAPAGHPLVWIFAPDQSGTY